jgi:hypothetical protein
MARSVVERITSDLSGVEIEPGHAWVMELHPPDGRRLKVRLDISAKEAAEFAAKGQEVKRRGRPPGASIKRSSVKDSTVKRATAKSTAKRGSAKKVSANGRRRRKSTSS